MFDGKIYNIRVYDHVLTSQEIYRNYFYTRVDYLTWYQRLWFWFCETWKLLLGKKEKTRIQISKLLLDLRE